MNLTRSIPASIAADVALPPSRFIWRVRPPSTLQLVSAAIIAVVLLPLAYLVIRAVGAGETGLHYLFNLRTLAVVWNSLLLTAAVAISAALIGVPFAWLTARTDLPLRRLWLVTGLLAMVIPSYLGAITFIAAFGPRGLLQQVLAPLGIDRLPPIYGFFGTWLAITLFTFPYVVLPVRAALLNLDPALEEAGRSMGLSRWQVLRRITLPQLRPALASGMLLTALYTLSDFGVVSMMRYDAFTRVIYTQYTSSFDRSRAAILSLVLVALTIGLLLLERRTAKITRNYRIGCGAQRAASKIALGRWKALALVFCLSVVLLAVAVPVGILVMWAAQTQGIETFSAGIIQTVTNTASVSGITALVVAAAALPLAILSVRSASRINQWLVRLSYFGYVLPGLVVALALVFFTANLLPALYQTLPILILGYATRFLPMSVGTTSSALTQVNPRYEEAARGMGLRGWQVMLRITVPLTKSGLLAGAALVFLNVMKELPTTLLLAPTGFKTLPVDIWSSYESARWLQIGIPGLVLMAVSAVSLYFILGRDR